MLATLALGSLGAVAASRARAATQVKAVDVVGREIVLDRPARRIVIGPWVTLDALALVHPDPASLLVGWGGDAGANRFQLDTFRGRFPAIDKVPVIGRNTIETMSMETIIASRPDLVVFSRLDAYRFGPADTNPQLAQLEAAGIPVAIVDFFLDPGANTEPSLRLLGALLGREEQAKAFLDFYGTRFGRLKQRLAGVPLPSVMFHAFAARPECCWTTGPGNRDPLISPAGGHNIGADVLKGAIGQLNLEFVYTRQPRFYVATGGGDAVATQDAFAIGRDVSAARARESFRALLQRPDIAAIDAVEQGRAFGVWHNFVHTPLRIAAVEALARGFHPDLFGDVDPEGTLAEINARFLPVPLEGTFWISAA
ncbi:ferrichrome ABC transporter substrate-binding protein [Azorhizobium oxalatiphilum]|uniref:Ferrichrome ABC transporter substrate-binding protein n=2 Tax=Azorhizobium oxalatiphilum TaxID=980631 RepID=A0A917BML8_9HYPH|nr:ferrichrome ABC transporter substrate-binding protein [Azorhizobium oxalatiphilum]